MSYIKSTAAFRVRLKDYLRYRTPVCDLFVLKACNSAAVHQTSYHDVSFSGDNVPFESNVSFLHTCFIWRKTPITYLWV